MTDRIRRIDLRLQAWLARHGIDVLRVGLGVVFLWFGGLKFFPGLSPAEALIVETVDWCVDPVWFIPALAVWEVTIGLGLVTNRFLRLTIASMLAHMAGTFMPLVTCPQHVWTTFPYAWTLEGQYILKNLVLVGAALVIAGSLRRARRGGPAADDHVDPAVTYRALSRLSRRREGIARRVPFARAMRRDGAGAQSSARCQAREMSL